MHGKLSNDYPRKETLCHGRERSCVNQHSRFRLLRMKKVFSLGYNGDMGFIEVIQRNGKFRVQKSPIMIEHTHTPHTKVNVAIFHILASRHSFCTSFVLSNNALNIVSNLALNNTYSFALFLSSFFWIWNLKAHQCFSLAPLHFWTFASIFIHLALVHANFQLRA